MLTTCVCDFNLYGPPLVFPYLCMSAKAKRKTVGRPPSGNKPFCIRMQPGAYDNLSRAAKADGCRGVGDWLNKKAADFSQDQTDPTALSPSLVNRYDRAFRQHAEIAANAISKFADHVKIHPTWRVDDDDLNQQALNNVKLALASLNKWVNKSVPSAEVKNSR